MTDSDRATSARRDWQERYATGRSGNPAGRPRGALNRATRIAAELLDGKAEALWRTEIDLALAGDRVLLRHCNDRIIAPQRAQPVAFAMPRIENAADLAAAMGALRSAPSSFMASAKSTRRPAISITGFGSSASRCCASARVLSTRLPRSPTRRNCSKPTAPLSSHTRRDPTARRLRSVRQWPAVASG